MAGILAQTSSGRASRELQSNEVEEREWHVLVREPDGNQGRYVYWRPEGALPPERDDIIEIDPLTKVRVLDVEPKQLRPGEIGIIRGRRQLESG